jgi:hypothetical protein
MTVQASVMSATMVAKSSAIQSEALELSACESRPGVLG